MKLEMEFISWYKSFMHRLAGIPFFILLLSAGWAACEPQVNCERLCEKALQCEVTFEAPDDPDDDLVESGERTELESCMMGCKDSPLATQEAAECIDDLESDNPAVCQEQTLECLDVESV